MSVSAVPLAFLLLAAVGCFAQHPCGEEVASACPDRPGPEIAQCLKDTSAHERPTTISSECADFIALNVACADAINAHCDDAFFSPDTMLCLTKWTDQDRLSPKCSGVMKWAIPREDVTDELGLSDKDYAEKKEWQAKRKGARTAAIENIKETNAQKREMERLKDESPEEYKERLALKEEVRKQKEEQRKTERLAAAARERKWREDNPEVVEAQAEAERAKTQRRKGSKGKQLGKADQGSWLPVALGGLFAAFVLFNILNFFTKDKDQKDKKSD